MNGKQFIKLLQQNGWSLDRVEGSHHILIKGDKTLCVPVHRERSITCADEARRVKMILQYPARIKYSAEDKTYLVEFPDLPGCLTEGKTLELDFLNYPIKKARSYCFY